MYIKMHKDNSSEVTAISDENLIGKSLEDEKISLLVGERFYKGEKVSEEEAAKILEKSKNINAVGEESVKLCVKLGLVDEDKVVKIKGVPHAQIIAT